MSHLNPKSYPTILSLPLHRETYIAVFHLISCLTDHKTQMLKKRKCWSFPYFQFPRCCVVCLRDTCFEFQYFSFLIIRKDLRELLLSLVIFALQQEKKKKKKRNKQNNKKRYNLMIQSLLSNHTSNDVKFNMTSTCGKNLWPPTQKWNKHSYLQ